MLRTIYIHMYYMYVVVTVNITLCSIILLFTAYLSNKFTIIQIFTTRSISIINIIDISSLSALFMLVKYYTGEDTLLIILVDVI